MNARPTPHIGATLAQQRAILLYRMQQRELQAERARFERIRADLQVDALLDRIRQNDAAGCADYEEVPPPAPLWLVAVGSSLWTLLLIVGMVLAAVQCGWLS
ncbi:MULTISPECIES: hypothetical protein [unclassified Rhodanobacter]|uniref:hypothetical protein n=1 Tax=unclassified Rhodanobacter TaxID=2621553 RepID=UPI001BDEE87A|nr:MULTISPECIES: hypothetical protein [unclassified Rhodanobacter]MBT2142721.1 hypothetical protein [Rhodanobacter sp. LX-99]MBT2148206.1 hypothetical protein [Rhodanobacter sp. LX-100]